MAADSTNKEFITILGARENNLKNIDLKIPRGEYTVVTGLSGSGKSSLALDTVYSEGLRRYIECLSTYARQFLERVDRPDIDEISGLPTAIAIENRNSVRNSRSTVGTTTEIYDFLRLLFSKIGRIFCPGCGDEIFEQSPESIKNLLYKSYSGSGCVITIPVENSLPPEVYLSKGFTRYYSKEEFHYLEDIKKFPKNSEIVIDRIKIESGTLSRLTESLETAFTDSGRLFVHLDQAETMTFTKELECNRCHIKFQNPTPALFSFNSPQGACIECNGFGNNLEIDPELVVPNPQLSISEGAIEPFTKPSYKFQMRRLKEFAENNAIDTDKPFCDLSREHQEMVYNGDGKYRGVHGFFKRLEQKSYKMHIRVFLSKYRSAFKCNTCNGSRLKDDALWVKINGCNIYELTLFTIDKFYGFFENIELSSAERDIAGDILKEILTRSEFMLKVGLQYLTLSRLTRSLSGGESQRVNLACQLGSKLTETLYVLDEPSIGLHPKNIHQLIKIIEELKNRNNTVILVEHDHEMIRAADNIIELGPEAGELGGQIVYEGPFKNFLNTKAESYTKKYLTGEKTVESPLKRRNGSKNCLSIIGAEENNLKKINVDIPLQTLTCVTGVSGSGKSSLVNNVLYANLARRFKSEKETAGRVKEIKGFENISDIILLDQSPIGRSGRSNPATYIKVYDEIRKVISGTALAKVKGFTPSHFSFNVKSGRCESCQGEGTQKIEMLFLADVVVTCEECNGKRFKKEILDYKYKGKNVNEILNLTIDEASQFFSESHKITRMLSILQQVGLGYLRLGQSAVTLSGGEAQRIKIAKELARKNGQGILYILDEPTVGLHSEDVSKLLGVLNKLIDNGNSVIVIEHNMDVVKSADYIIDLGPEGGENGGHIVTKGTPEEILKSRKSHTAKFLKKLLN